MQSIPSISRPLFLFLFPFLISIINNRRNAIKFDPMGIYFIGKKISVLFLALLCFNKCIFIRCANKMARKKVEIADKSPACRSDKKFHIFLFNHQLHRRARNARATITPFSRRLQSRQKGGASCCNLGRLIITTEKLIKEKTQLKRAGNWSHRRKNLSSYHRNSRGGAKFHARNRAFQRRETFLRLAGKICRQTKIFPLLIPGTFEIQRAAEGGAWNREFTRTRRRCGINQTTWTKSRATPERDRVFRMRDYGIGMRTICSNQSCGTSWVTDWCCIDWKYAFRRLCWARFSDYM